MKRYLFPKAGHPPVKRFLGRKRGGWKKWSVWFAVFSVLGGAALGVVAIAGALAMAKEITTVKAESVQEVVSAGREQLRDLASQPLLTQGCLSVLRGLLGSSALLTVPLVQTFDSLKGECWAGAGSRAGTIN